MYTAYIVADFALKLRARVRWILSSEINGNKGSVTMAASILKVLLICDNPSNISLIHELFKDNQIANCLYVAQDVHMALNYLRDDDPNSAVVHPDIIFIDLALSRKSGFETLRELKGDSRLSIIPVVVLLPSQAEKEVVKNLQVTANYYVTLPLTLHSLLNALRLIFKSPSVGVDFAQV